MDAMPKGQMPIRRAPDVKTVRVRKLSLVSIRRADLRNYPLPGTQTLTAQFHIRHGLAKHHLHRRAIAQHLFNRLWNQSRIGTQLLQRFRIIIEAEQRIVKQMSRRLVASHQQQHTKAKQFLFGQALPLDFRSQQSADKIILWLAPPLLDDTAEVRNHFRPWAASHATYANNGIRPYFEARLVLL